MDEAEFAIRFSWQPNQLCHCGPKEGPAAFAEYLTNKGSVASVREAIKKFEGLYPYLDLYAKKLGKDILDPQVLEAYWIGSELSKGFTKADFKTLFAALSSRGLPESLAARLLENLPANAMPTHAFHVLYVGPGNTSGTVKPTLPVKDTCLISPATVVAVGANLTVTRQPLVLDNGILSFGSKETFTAHYLPQLLPIVKPGDVVALHWGFACMVLDEDREQRLRSYNKDILTMMNAHFTASA